MRDASVVVRWHETGVKLPRAWWPWCFSQGSLTGQLIARFGALTVRPVGQGRAAITQEERLLLREHLRQAYVREVVLIAGGVAVVFARSVLPLSSASAWPLFFRVGTRSLGALLFTDPRIRRGSLTAASVGSRHWLWQRAVAAGLVLSSCPARLVARRSLFWRLGEPLLVQELFLPGFQP
jgi:chorismate--pyruvate lyase